MQLKHLPCLCLLEDRDYLAEGPRAGDRVEEVEVVPGLGGLEHEDGLVHQPVAEDGGRTFRGREADAVTVLTDDVAATLKQEVEVGLWRSKRKIKSAFSKQD